MIADLKEAFAHKELLQNLTLRELRTRYRRSLLGWGWSLLNPLVIIVCYTLVFSVILKVKPNKGFPSGNHTFAFFLMAALLPWNYFQNSILGATTSMLGAHALIGKVYFPRELIVFANVLSNLVTLIIELSVVNILLVSLGYIALQYLPWLLLIMILETLFLTGLALFLSAASVRSRDIPYLTGLALTVWFFMTPIVWSETYVHNDQALFGVTLPLRTLLLLNPMARFSIVYRNILWDIRTPGLATVGVLFAVSVVVFIAGYRFFTRRARYFAEEL
jgi:ABC-2 type transport system permease protein